MLTIGDSFSIVAILVGLGLTTWSLIAVIAFLFPARVQIASEKASARPWASFGLGILMLVVLTIGFILFVSPAPGAKLLGMIVFLGALMVGVLGVAGLAQIAARRLSPNLSSMNTDPQAFLKAAGFIVTAGMLPVLGWFLFMPVVLIVSMGAGLSALLHRSPVLVPQHSSEM